jgi:2-formylbenzoate dehydrogenase
MTAVHTASTAADRVRGRDWHLHIGGRPVPAAGGRTYSTIDPSTGAPLAEVADAGAEDVARAYEAAEAASRSWARTSMVERAAVVRAMARLLEEHSEELAVLDALDSGNPLPAMRTDVRNATTILQIQAGLGISLRGEAMDGGSTHLHYTRLEPFGVVGRIVAYNHPILYAAARATPALLAGNAVILKPAPQTPLSALRWAELVSDLLPPGLFNVVTGSGAATGEAIVGHPGIRRIAFIGSVPVGRAIQEGAARAAVKTVTLELGGKNPMVVFPDADIEAAAKGAFDGMNLTSVQGQSCGSNSRVIVHQDVLEPFAEALAARLDALTVGPALAEGTDMGPLISDRHLASVQEWIRRGAADGATPRLICPVGDDLPPGYYTGPALFSDVTPDMALAQEEVFGPVIGLMSFRSEDEALRLANDVRYGLTASVWTEDLRRAHRMAHRLEAGYVWVNESTTHFPGTPFGGVKESGVGREEAADEISSYAQVKSVHVRFG